MIEPDIISLTDCPEFVDIKKSIDNLNSKYDELITAKVALTDGMLDSLGNRYRYGIDVSVHEVYSVISYSVKVFRKYYDMSGDLKLNIKDTRNKNLLINDFINGANYHISMIDECIELYKYLYKFAKDVELDELVEKLKIHEISMVKSYIKLVQPHRLFMFDGRDIGSPKLYEEAKANFISIYMMWKCLARNSIETWTEAKCLCDNITNENIFHCGMKCGLTSYDVKMLMDIFNTKDNLNRFRATIKNLSNELSKLKQQNSNNEQIKLKDATIKNLSNELSKSNATIKNLNNELSKSNATIKNLNNETYKLKQSTIQPVQQSTSNMSTDIMKKDKPIENQAKTISDNQTIISVGEIIYGRKIGPVYTSNCFMLKEFIKTIRFIQPAIMYDDYAIVLNIIKSMLRVLVGYYDEVETKITLPELTNNEINKCLEILDKEHNNTKWDDINNIINIFINTETKVYSCMNRLFVNIGQSIIDMRRSRQRTDSKIGYGIRIIYDWEKIGLKLLKLLSTHYIRNIINDNDVSDSIKNEITTVQNYANKRPSIFST